ncbi:MAG TPA: beta-1,3-glucanase family protein [Candidatus Baltobacteraceae bacterium]|nr:beta-1,3-glucanase family protein [Candidatus Baltobacteraceae bacterium]
MRLPLPWLGLSIAGAIALAGCSGTKSFTPFAPSPSRLTTHAACPKPGKGVPLIIKDQSGLAASSLTLYFTSSNPKNLGQFQYLDAQGAMTLFAPGNEATAFPVAQCFPGTLGKAGAKFAFPLLPGGKIWIAFGKLTFKGAANGQFTAPTGWGKGQPGYDVPWDVVELSFNNPGIFVNLTRVDMLGLPLNLQVLPANKSEPFKQIGENLAQYPDILKAFVNNVPFNRSVVLAGTSKVPRIINPSHVEAFPDVFGSATFFAGGYLNKVVGYYKKPPQKIVYGTAYKGAYCPGSWQASSDGTHFIFTQGGSTTNIPVSLFTTNYIFADDPAPKYTPPSCAFLLDKILLQELNRGVAMTSAHPQDIPKTFYPKDQIDNQYACILHNYSLHYATYAFAFDDAADQASIIKNSAPTSVQLTIGAIPKTLPKPTTKQFCTANYK